MQVLQYTPRVQCIPYGYVPDLTACKKVLQLVPASHNPDVFGPRGQVGVDVGMPATYDEGEFLCMFLSVIALLGGQLFTDIVVCFFSMGV